MGSGFSKMKKQARMMQDQLAKMQEEMKKTFVEGISGGGLVKVQMNGEKVIQKIEIHPDCVDPQDIEGLQDLIIAAQKDALKKIPDNTSDFPGLNSFGF